MGCYSISFERLALLLWRIWKSRNDWCFRAKPLSPQHIITSAQTMEDNFNRWVGKQSKQTHAQQYPPQSSTPQSAQNSPTSMQGLSQLRRTPQRAPPPPDLPPNHNMPPTDPPPRLNSPRTETPPLFYPPQIGETPPTHESSNQPHLSNRQQASPWTDLQLRHNSPPTDPPPSHHSPRTVMPPLPIPLRTGDIPPNRAFSPEKPLKHNSHHTKTAARHDSPQIHNPPANGAPQIWIPPAKGVLKVNVDGSFLPETGEAGVACVCRDSRGVLVDGFVRTVRVSSALQAEAQAFLQTLK